MIEVSEVLSGLTFEDVKKAVNELMESPVLPNGKDYKEWVLSNGQNGRKYSLILGWDRFNSFASSSVVEDILSNMVYGDKYGFDCIYFNLCSCKSGKNPKFFKDWNKEECGNYILNDNNLRDLLDYFKSQDFEKLVYSKVL